MSEQDQNRGNRSWMDKPATDRQLKAIRFILSEDDKNTELAQEAENVKTIGQANLFLNKHWKAITLEGPGQQEKEYRKIFIPRAFARTLTVTPKQGDKAGQPFHTIVFKIPKGVRDGGTDLSGFRISQNLSEQYEKQLARREGSITLYLPAGKPVELWKREGDTDRIIHVDPDRLVQAFIAHRREYMQKIQEERETSQPDNNQKPEERENPDNKNQEETRKQEESQQEKDYDQTLTPMEREDEVKSERRVKTAATSLGITAGAIQVSGTIVPGYTAFRLALPNQPNHFTQWHTIHYLASQEEVSRSIGYMAGKAGITVHAPEPAKPRGIGTIIQQQSTKRNGKLSLTGSAVRNVVKQMSQEARREAGRFPTPTLTVSRQPQER